MPKLKTIYICQNCGHTSSQWVGQCPSCGGWNTFIEEVTQVSATAKTGISGGTKGRYIEVKKLSDVVSKPPKRLSSNIEEFDRVLGGGFVPGQVILLGG